MGNSRRTGGRTGGKTGRDMIIRAFVRVCAAFLLCGVLLSVGSAGGTKVYAAGETGAEEQSASDHGVRYTNPLTGYQVIILDEADLIPDAEEAALAERMQEVTAYGNAAVKCQGVNTKFSMEDYLDIQYGSLFSGQSGMLVFVDAYTMQPYVRCQGKLGRMIDERRAKGLENNMRSYTVQQRIGDGADLAFQQAMARAEEIRRQRPVKYACNAMLALIIAMLVNFALVNALSRMQQTSERELFENNTVGYCRHGEVMIEYLTRTETYHPQTKR